jgi:MFS family permease
MVITGRFLTFKTMKPIAFWGVFFIFFGWIMAGFTSTIVGLIIMYGVFIGIGVGMLYGIPIMLIQSQFKQHSGFYTGLVLGGFGLSPLVTAPFIRTILTFVSLQQTFIIMGLSTFIILLFTSAPLSKIPYSDTKTVTPQGTSITIDRRFVIVYGLFLLGTTIGLMMIGLSYQIGVQYYQFSAVTVTIAMTVFALANGLSRLLFGYLSDRYAITLVMMIALIILLVSGVIAYLNNGTYYVLYLVSFSGFWFILGAWLAIAPNAIKTLYGLDNYSKRYGVLFTAYGFGALIGVSSSGLLLDALNKTQWLYIGIIGITLISYLVLYINKNVLSHKG